MKIIELTLTQMQNIPGVTAAALNRGQNAAHVLVDIAKLEEGASLSLNLAGRFRRYFVVSGRGRVVGDDGVEHPIGPDCLIEMVPREQHTLRADSDLVAVIIEEHS